MRRLEAIAWLPGVAAGVLLFGSAVSSAPRLEFPSKHNMFNVMSFGAKGDGVTNDRAAIVAAISTGGVFPNPRIIYFPAGTYLVDDVLDMGGNNGTDINCCVAFQGQGPEYSVIKLKDNATGFTSSGSPKSLVFTEAGNMSFRYNISDIKIEIGNGNAGAMALDWIDNNEGALDDVALVSDDGNAFVGLEMTRAWPGPCLVKNLTVDGFQYGIRVSQGQYSVTLETITVRNQKTAGFANGGNFLSIHRLVSVNTVPAFTQSGGMTELLDASMTTPSGQTSTRGAIENSGGYLYARNDSATGYAAVIKNGGTNVAGNPVKEYFSNTTKFSLFSDTGGALKLEAKSAPEFHENDTSKWVCITDHTEGPSTGGTPRASLRAAMQYAAANGKTTVYAPQTSAQLPYPIYNGSVDVPPQVKCIEGFDATIMTAGARLRLNVTGNTTDPLIIDHVFFSGVTLNDASSRPVVIKHCQIDTVVNSPGCGDLFIEDMSPIVFLQNPQKVWMRQFNPERLTAGGGANAWQVLRFEAWGCQVWILGLKSEGAGTLLIGRKNAAIELLGCYALPVDGFTAAMAAAPAFLCDESCMSLIYGLAGGYSIDVTEIRGGVTKQLQRSQVSTGYMPLYLANKGCPFVPAAVAPRSEPATAAVSAERPARLSCVTALRRVSLPAGVGGFALFNLRGEKVWQFSRRAGGAVTVDIPGGAGAAGIAVVKYAGQ